MPKPEKVATVAEIAERFRSSQGAVLTEYRGLSVAQLTQLRRSISGHATYAVVKNTLTALAAAQAGVTAFDGQLTGPTAVAFVTGDPVEAAKSLRDFARNNPALVIKAGLLEGKALSADEVRQLADLESREVLLAKLAGAMKASLSNAVSLFAAPLSQAARTFDALRQKVEATGGALPGAEAATADAPAAEPATAEAPAAEPATAEAPAAEPADEGPTDKGPTDEG